MFLCFYLFWRRSFRPSRHKPYNVFSAIQFLTKFFQIISQRWVILSFPIHINNTVSIVIQHKSIQRFWYTVEFEPGQTGGKDGELYKL